MILIALGITVIFGVVAVGTVSSRGAMMVDEKPHPFRLALAIGSLLFFAGVIMEVMK